MNQCSVEEVERAIRKRQNEAQISELQQLFQTRMNVAGLTREDYLTILRELQPHLPELDSEFMWLNFLQDLWESQWFEARLLALQLMYATPELVDTHLWAMLEHWTHSVDNWVLADWLGHVRAIAIYKAPTLVMRMAPWIQSVDPWRRRSALVSLVYIDPHSMERHLILQPHETLAFLEPIVSERHPAVQSAMVWLMRQVAESHPNILASFLRQNRDRLPAEVLAGLARHGFTVQ